MPPIQWEQPLKALREPALVCGFGGWTDAANAGRGVVDYLVDVFAAERLGHIDDELFFDFADTRPDIGPSGDDYKIDWPEVVIYAARRPAERRDLLLVGGPEPAAHWQPFVAALLDFAQAAGVEQLVTLGATLEDVPHTRPPRLSCVASDPYIAELVGLPSAPRVGGTDMIGVLHTTFARAGIPAVSIMATAPRYAEADTNPCTVTALARKTCRALGMPADLRGLVAHCVIHTSQLDDTCEYLPMLGELLERLEEEIDAGPDYPTAEHDNLDPAVLAADYERYLRRRREAGEGGGD